MRINNVVSVATSNNSRNITFSRAPKKGSEEQEYRGTIEEALDYLGIKNRALIIHGTSFPASDKSNDIKTGTPIGADDFVDFAKLHGFNAIQLGPNGKLNKGDTSPYTSSVFEKNPLFINPNKLTKKEYASIVDEEDLEKIATPSENKGENYAETDFDEADKKIKQIMVVAYDNFQEKLKANDEDAKKLNKEYEKFKKDNDWLDNYSVLNILSDKYNTDYYPHWSEKDRNLIQDVKNENIEAKREFGQLQKDNKEEIDRYKFTQFVIDKQTKEDTAQRNDFTYISDLEVGSSSLDELVYKDVFLPDYKIGCKKGGVMDSPQLWGIAMPNPNKLFNDDGTLGESGKFIKAKLKNTLSGAQGIRIDHAIGLVNPYLYNPKTVEYETKIDKEGNEVNIPNKEKLQAGYLSELEIDKNKNYQKVLSKIILPTMREMNVNPNDVVWEDLGHDETGTFKQVFKKENNLSGISGMIWTKSDDAPRENWAYIGCHDNKPGRKMIEDGDIESRESWKSEYLSNSLRPDPYKKEERNELKEKIESSPKERWNAKVADLFHSTKNIQVSFMDFFGINKSYNTPGTSGGKNWTLRLNSNYKDTYYKSLEDEDGWAINMPETLSKAVQAKFDVDVSKNNVPYWDELNKITPIMNRLNHWSQVLKEKEE